MKLPKRHARKKLSWEQVVSKYAGTSQEKHAQPKQESRKSGYMNMRHDAAQYEEYAAEVAQLDTPLARQMQDNATAQLEAVAALYEEVMKTADNQRAIMEGIAEIYEQGENKV